MKNLLKLFLLIAFLLPTTAIAYDFEVNGIYYKIEYSKATVTDADGNMGTPDYSGEVTIPETVTYNGTTYPVTIIGDDAFYGCSGLTSIEIPNSVTKIERYVFYNCIGLTSINIPNSVTYIAESAFQGCTGLTSITVDVNNPNYDSRNNCNALIATASNRLLLGCQNTIIPNSVTQIWHCAFLGCRGLTSINIPSSVTYIGIQAFLYCSGLTSIDIPNSVIEIGDRAFKDCTRLTSIDIPNSVKYLGDWVFYGCYNLTSATIGDSVTSIGQCTFYECSRLTSVTIGNSVTTIDRLAFNICSSLTRINIPNSVTYIGDEAFYKCSSLTSITIPSSVTFIGKWAFEDCSSLNDVYSYIPDPSAVSVGYNGSSVFYLSSQDYTNRTLHVPAGSVAAYQADTRWSDFFVLIVEIGPVQAESIKLNVTTAGLNEGATLQLTATVLPEDCAEKTVLWSSNNPNVATVDSNGLVTTHSVGTATITAMTTDGSNLSTTCTVTLLPVSIKGDVNGDSNINISDVTKLIDYLLSGTWN